MAYLCYANTLNLTMIITELLGQIGEFIHLTSFFDKLN